MRPVILSISLLWVIAACSMLETVRTVRVLLPAPPASWQIAFPSLVFRVTARDGAGSAVCIDGRDWREPAVIACATTLNAPILAWPYVEDRPGAAGIPPGVLRPAGALFPEGLRAWNGEAVVELSWEGGAAALVLDRAEAAGADLARFNAARLLEYLGRESDPWKLDLDTAAQEIARGTFTAWDLDRLPARDVDAAFGPGTWFLESPFAALAVARDGVARLEQVTLGSHRVFSLGGSSWRLQVSGTDVFLSPPQGLALAFPG